jgi:hypothetical protein
MPFQAGSKPDIPLKTANFRPRHDVANVHSETLCEAQRGPDTPQPVTLASHLLQYTLQYQRVSYCTATASGRLSPSLADRTREDTPFPCPT